SRMAPSRNRGREARRGETLNGCQAQERGTLARPRRPRERAGVGESPRTREESSVDVDVDVDLDVNAVVVAVVSVDDRLLSNQSGQHRNNAFKNLSGIFERGFI